MKRGGTGGANTQSGLVFEDRVGLLALLKSLPGYSVEKRYGEAGVWVRFDGEDVARSLGKHDFYEFLRERGVSWSEHVSKRLLPDDALLVLVRNSLFIIEVKFQSVAGSVDEKLQTCDFKRKQYVRLLSGLGIGVEYVYVLNEWFKQPSYKDVLDYILSVGCHYYFDQLPLDWLGLPSQKETTN